MARSRWGRRRSSETWIHRTIADAIQTARCARRPALARGFQPLACQIAPKQMLTTGISATVSTTTFANLLPALA